jgi:hypothetical protein
VALSTRSPTTRACTRPRAGQLPRSAGRRADHRALVADPGALPAGRHARRGAVAAGLARLEGRVPGPIAWLDQQIASVPRDYGWWARARAVLKARALDKLGKKAEALRRTARPCASTRSPTTAAVPEPAARGPAQEFAALTTEHASCPRAGSAARRVRLRRARSPSRVSRARSSWCGSGWATQTELMRLGLRSPTGASEPPGSRRGLWATALLYDRAQQYDKSH